MRFSEDRRGRFRAVALVALFVAALVAMPRSAHATPNFPGAVRDHLKLAAEPSCSLCHAGTPGRGTVNTPFGATMRKRGLIAYDDGALRTALDALAAEQKDSDGDGVPDIRELESGADPNAGPEGGEDLTPVYGCAITTAPGAPSVSSGPPLLAMLFLGLLLMRVRAG